MECAPCRAGMGRSPAAPPQRSCSGTEATRCTAADHRPTWHTGMQGQSHGLLTASMYGHICTVAFAFITRQHLKCEWTQSCLAELRGTTRAASTRNCLGSSSLEPSCLEVGVQAAHRCVYILCVASAASAKCMMSGSFHLHQHRQRSVLWLHHTWRLHAGTRGIMLESGTDLRTSRNSISFHATGKVRFFIPNSAPRTHQIPCESPADRDSTTVIAPM